MKKDVANLNKVFSDYPVLCAVVGALAWFIFSAFEMFGSANEFYYIDTDCYARYLRITDWLSGDFSWFEKIFPFTNCPHGEVLHFTRINDVIWLIFSLPLCAHAAPMLKVSPMLSAAPSLPESITVSADALSFSAIS